ncbi:MAG: polyketide synthase [Herpetosiphonaceae bacterium]|nr:MAG: polyketide synthase [Herpetosiphonaceae bacterium]
MTNLDTTNYANSVAIIGIACRFPGANNAEQFWQNLRDGVESISFFSDEELLAAGVDPALLKHPNYVKARGIIDHHDSFDAAFFGYSPREAEILDPQQRVLLELAWQALESAGYDPSAYQGMIGVYAGVGVNTYIMSNIIPNRDIGSSIGDLQLVLGNDKDYVTTRISYRLNLEGPSVNVQSACSTSLVAVHLACQSLLSNECDLALAGGATVRTPQIAGYLYEPGGIMSPDGHCRAFSANAQGTVNGNGAGMVVLKRMEDALADGDTILAVIRGSAVNNDGGLKVGFTAPSIRGQARVIAEALAMAEVDPATITYVETHGTGTPMGDPIEVAALTKAFRAETTGKGYCAIGSVKTNVGHLDAAAGVAGLIKTVLALQHKAIPPSLHFTAPNPEIDFANSPFYVNAQLRDWPSNGGPRRAGVSSFGIGGTNAHAIVEEPPAPAPTSPARPWKLLVLSARTPAALEARTKDLIEHLTAHPELDIADVCYTLQVGRKAFAQRKVVLCRDREDALAALESADPERIAGGVAEQTNRPVIFMFPGQGSQHVGMAQELYASEPTFRKHIDQCATLLKPHLGLDLRELFYPSPERWEQAAQQLNQTWITQPALFSIEYALARLWMSWGVKPEAMIGHSLGEYVAACLAGVFSLEDALALVAARGRLMRDLPGGAMLAVPLPRAEVERLLNDELALAAHNGPRNCVVSGPVSAIEALQRELEGREVAVRRLRTSHAFHSPMMDPILEAFAEELRRVALKEPKLPFVSNVTGTWISAAEATSPDYWVRHLRQTVLMDEGLRTVLQQPGAVLLEVGPGRAMLTFARQNAACQPDQIVVASLPPAAPDAGELQPDAPFLLRTLGRLWLAGVPINWPKFSSHEQRRRVPLPTYPFERQRYWLDAQPQAQSKRQPVAGKKPDLTDWFYVPVWKQVVRRSSSTQSHAQDQRWLIFAGEKPFSRQLVQRLAVTDRQIAVISPGAGFAALGDDRWTINPNSRADYEALFAALRSRGFAPDMILYLWSLESGGANGPTLETVERAQRYCLHGLLFLAQALAAQPGGEPPRITIITANAQAVTGDDLHAPEQALALGPATVIPQELQQLHCRVIDIAAPEMDERRKEQLIDLLLEECAAEGPALVALRGTQRWQQIYEPVRLEGDGALPLRQGGAYLITGGLGGMGLELALYLARHFQARLALVGRSAFPAREEWERWRNEHLADDPVSRTIDRLLQCEAAGAEVLVLQADVSNAGQMAAALRAARERFGPLNGVIHAAGVGGGGIIQFQDPAKMTPVLAPKVQGTLVLADLLRDEPLDVLVLCSSVRSVIGGPGRIDYCAANVFLDSFARYQATSGGLPVISINWDTWQSVGMSVEAARRMNIDPSVDLADGMTPAEGVEVFQRSLSCGLPQVIVATQDLELLIEREKSAAAALLGDRLNLFQQPKTLHPRPALATPYVAPTTETERILAAIWQELLGIEEVGIHDNFFELGGDSVVSIQLIARASRAGLQLSPNQIFEHQTIAGLAAVAGTAQTILADQGPITGPVPLTPIQRWFFELELSEPHHWNQSVLLDAPERLRPELIERAIPILLAHHDALRLRFQRDETGWSQFNVGPEDDQTVPFSLIDLSAVAPGEQDRALEEAANRLQASLDLTVGPLMRVALVERGPDLPQQLLMIVHHLAIDGVSWRVLLEDFWTIYYQLRDGQFVNLPPKTTSFKHWAERLVEYAQSPALRDELAYWLEPREQIAIPIDFPGGLNTVESMDLVPASLSAAETQALLQEAPRAYQTQINDLLLTALAMAMSKWTGQRDLLVDLEGHGREPIAGDIDLSRTVGWFTTIFPIALQLPEQEHLGERLKAIKEQLRRVPGRGFPYGVGRYLSQDRELREALASAPQPAISFLYLGQFDQGSPGGEGQAGGSPQSPRDRRHYLLEISGFIADGELQLQWRYSRNLHRRSTIEALAGDYLAALRTLVEHCVNQETTQYTPSDFPKAKLSQKDLDTLMSKLQLN